VTVKESAIAPTQSSNTSDNQKQKKEPISNGKMLLIIFSFIPPLCYLIGVAYYQGYLEKLGIHYEFFSKSTEEYLVISYTSLVAQGLYISKTIIEHGLVLSIVLLLCFILYLIVDNYKAKLSGLILNKFRFKRRHIDNFAKGYLIFSGPYLVAFAIFYLTLPAYISYRTGMSAALTQIEKFEDCKPKEGWNECYEIKEGGKSLTKGLLIARSDSSIAIYNEQGATIHPLTSNTTILRIYNKRKK